MDRPGRADLGELVELGVHLPGRHHVISGSQAVEICQPHEGARHLLVLLGGRSPDRAIEAGAKDEEGARGPALGRDADEHPARGHLPVLVHRPAADAHAGVRVHVGLVEDPGKHVAGLGDFLQVLAQGRGGHGKLQHVSAQEVHAPSPVSAVFIEGTVGSARITALR